MPAFVISRKVALPADKIWSVCKDFGKAPGPGVTVEVEEHGSPYAYNLGCVRVVTIGNVKVRERLIAIDPPRGFSYTILSGAPMKNHVGKAEIIPIGMKTEIRWNVEFQPKVPGIGWIVSMVTKKAVNQYIDAIEKGAGMV